MAAIVQIAIVETTVYGVTAYYAQCLACGWRCHKQAHSAEMTAVRCAHRHDCKTH